MSDVPNEIFREILRRVPAEPLLRFRCVCKEWQHTIDDPDFAELHCDRQMGDMLLITNSAGKLYFVSLRSLDRSENNRTIEAMKINNLIRSEVRCVYDLPKPSCHGLLLLPHYDPKNVWVVWNPFIISERLELLSPPCDCFTGTELEQDKGTACVGIAYDPATDDYKVVRVSRPFGPRHHNSDGVLKTLIYSLKSRAWRRIEDFPNSTDCWGIQAGVFCNGALHWIGNVNEEGRVVGCIIALDVNTERHRKIPLPSVYCYAHRHLDALGGCLFLSCSHIVPDNSLFVFGVWMLQDYGDGKEKWTKLISWENDEGWDLRPLAYIKSKGQVVVQRNRNRIMWFDLEKKKWVKIVSLEGIEGEFCCQVLPASLNWFNGSWSGSADISIASPEWDDSVKLKLTYCSP